MLPKSQKKRLMVPPPAARLRKSFGRSAHQFIIGVGWHQSKRDLLGDDVKQVLLSHDVARRSD